MLGFMYTIFAVVSEGGGGSLIDVDPGLIFWTVITFVALLLILRKVAWKPMLTALDERESAIKESLEKAEKAQAEAQKVLKENEANLAKAEEESKKIIDQSRSYAEKLKDQMLVESRQQAKKMIDDATAEIERKREASFNELKAQVSAIAVDAAEKILKENLDQEKNRKIVDNYINEITKN